MHLAKGRCPTFYINTSASPTPRSQSQVFPRRCTIVHSGAWRQCIVHSAVHGAWRRWKQFFLAPGLMQAVTMEGESNAESWYWCALPHPTLDFDPCNTYTSIQCKQNIGIVDLRTTGTFILNEMFVFGSGRTFKILNQIQNMQKSHKFTFN